MRISTQTWLKHLSAGGAIRAIARAGFDCYDFSMFDHSEKNPVFQSGWREYILSLRDTAEECGIICNQAHAPYPSSKLELPENATFNETIFDKLIRSMEAAAMLGAKVIVIHPKQHFNYWEHAEELFEINMEFYRSLAPYAKEFGIQIGLENMWQMRDGHIVDSTCSSPEEFNRYIDTLADDCFTACLDLGHCGLTGHEAGAMIRAMGKRIGALHIHDNDNVRDSHTLPFNGVMDWADIMSALGEIGYEGDFTYEADGYLPKLPADMTDAGLTYAANMARVLAARIDAARK